MKSLLRLLALLPVMGMLVACATSVTGFPKACMDGDLEQVRQQVASGADVHRPDEHTQITPLALASFKGHLEVAAFLISCGADVNQQDVDGQTALMAALENDHFPVADLLLSHGADLGARTRLEYTPLMYVAIHASPQSLAYLLDKGADIEQTTKLSRNALQLAALNGRLDNMRVLIRRGADARVTDSNGDDCVALVAKKYGVLLQNAQRHNNATTANTARIIASSPGANMKSAAVGGVALGLLGALTAPNPELKVCMVAAVEHLLKLPSEAAEQGLPAFDTREFEERLVERWTRLANGENFFEKGQIPPKKASAGRKSFGVPAEEELLGLADITVFGACDEGLAITPAGIYWNSGEGPNQVSWKAFRDLTIMPHGSLNYHIRMGRKDDLEVAATTVGMGQWLELLLDIQAMLFEYRL